MHMARKILLVTGKLILYKFSKIIFGFFFILADYTSVPRGACGTSNKRQSVTDGRANRRTMDKVSVIPMWRFASLSPQKWCIQLTRSMYLLYFEHLVRVTVGGPEVPKGTCT